LGHPIALSHATRDDNDQPPTASAIPLLLTIADRFSPRNIHILLPLVIAVRTRLSPASVLDTLQLTFDVRAALAAAKRP
jgi:hypothetical protein